MTKSYLVTDGFMTHSQVVDRLRSKNAAFSLSFQGNGVLGQAGQGVLILTCMDSRVVPHEIFGLGLGDAKVIRNAGGQLNPEVEKDIVLASNLLNCHTIVIMPHTKCAMASMSVEVVQQRLEEISGNDFSNFHPRMIEDSETRLREDMKLLQNNPLIREVANVFGAIYDVDTGLVTWID